MLPTGDEGDGSSLVKKMNTGVTHAEKDVYRWGMDETDAGEWWILDGMDIDKKLESESARHARNFTQLKIRFL